jgi:hypothetical protein
MQPNPKSQPKSLNSNCERICTRNKNQHNRSKKIVQYYHRLHAMIGAIFYKIQLLSSTCFKCMTWSVHCETWTLDGIYGMQIVRVDMSACKDSMCQQLLPVWKHLLCTNYRNLSSTLLGTGVFHWFAIHSNRYQPTLSASLPFKFQIINCRL